MIFCFHVSCPQLGERDKARTSRNPHLEKMLHGQVKQSVGMDRSQWLDDLLKTGDWNEIRRLRKGHPPIREAQKRWWECCRIRPRAETLVNYFESVQWAACAITEPPHSTCDDPLLVSNTSISEAEVVESLKSLKRRKTAGSDGIPPEFWKAMCTYNSPACRWAVLLQQGLDWRLCTDILAWSNCGNYLQKRGSRLLWKITGPIFIACSWLPNICSNFFLRRLKDAGAEDRIWPTQFGFRSGCGCADALFIARRKVENAWTRKNGNAHLIQFLLQVWSMQCRASVFHVISVQWSVAFTMGGTSWCEMEA